MENKETVEEAAKRAVKSGLFKDETLFIVGTKWQADKIYSEKLPSDEEIENEAKKYTESTPDNDPIRIITFIQGAKWVIELIKQQGK